MLSQSDRNVASDREQEVDHVIDQHYMPEKIEGEIEKQHHSEHITEEGEPSVSRRWRKKTRFSVDLHEAFPIHEEITESSGLPVTICSQTTSVNK